MTLSEAQEQALLRHAEITGAWRHVVFHFAAKGDLGRLHEVRPRIPAADGRAILAYDAVCSAEDSSLAERVLTRLADEPDIWLYYTLAKSFLARGDLAQAFHVARLSVPADAMEGKRNSCVLNLIIKYLIREGSIKEACDLIGGALRLNAQQADLAALRTRLLEGERPGIDLYLGVLPAPQTVTAYVPVYNGGPRLGDVLDSLLGQSYPLHEYLVIDDGSTDDSVAVAERRSLRVLRHDANRGLAAARNTAFRAATGRYVLAIDADALTDTDMLKYMMMEFENALPAVAGVGARLIEQYRETLPDQWRSCHLSQDSGPERVAPIEAMSGAKTLFLRDAVLGIGGYDERYRTNYEDVDICRRLRAEGYELVAAPYALAGHLRRDTATSVVRTAWNYVFWATYEAGYYATPEAVAELLARSLRAASEVLQWDASNGNEHLLYLDLLYLVTTALCDVGFAARERTFSSAQARSIQEGILDAACQANAPSGALLGAALRRDTEHLLVPDEAGSVPAVFEPYLEVLGRFMEAADAPLCEELVRLADADSLGR